MAEASLKSISIVSGRLTDASGKPMANLQIRLLGAPRSLRPFSLWEEWAGRIQKLLKPDPNEFAYFDAETTSTGDFHFSGVHPGWYRLVIGGDGSRIPELYYPGVSRWPDAKVINIEEGQSITGLSFQLPGANLR